ncbi:hypothetical protein Deba_1510 [Desulfarculus baarsii DSM 2075]|uniref:Uncharacterized protein n=1 Tax=Desulfarculus baarsii (strain ATCC 33931 / DSM 2075 / LMG 7858 / VKM B-1802 / 2st14) TaxID=644282 RepID=E1QH35_DESB2|nr:hypothetical protein [Desulfarculus baarsii]ADK84878.1 hypothetical protein Deba_1510 [Desulfarculus baarsii DSM 2075]
MNDPRVEIIKTVGTARFFGRRLRPLQWRPLLGREAGHAVQALAILEAAGLFWRGLAWPDGRAADERSAPGDLPAVLGLELASLCRAPWLDDDDRDDLLSLDKHLRSARDYPQLSCAACAQQRAAGEDAADCRGCPHQPPPDAALAALEFVSLLADLPKELRAVTLAAAGACADPARPWALPAQLALIHRYRRGEERR